MASVSQVLSQSVNTETDSTQKEKKTRNTGEMGKDQFLQLLVTQLKYQDPLKPMDDKEFVSQMAQFSSLEQMQNLNSSMSSMKAFSLMGKSIYANYTDTETGEQTFVNGIVEMVRVEKGKVFVRVGEHDIPIEEINEISDSTVKSVNELMQLVGKLVEGKLAEEGGGIIDVSGRVTSVKKENNVDYAVLEEIELSEVDVVLPEGVTEYKKDYLQRNIGKEVIIQAQDELGMNVHIKAVLEDMKENGDKFDVKLSGVMVPVDNIRGIKQVSDTGSGSITNLMSLIGKNVDSRFKQENGAAVNISGQVARIRNSDNSNYAVLNGVRLTNADVELPSGFSGTKDQFLSDNMGKEVTAIVEDATGRKVYIKGIMQGSQANGENFDITLNGIEVPVSDIKAIGQ